MENTTAVKMTTVNALKWVLENVPEMPADVRERISAVKTTYENRKSSVSKATKERRAENDTLTAEILEWMQEGQRYSATDVMSAFIDRIKSNQRAARLLNDAVKDGALIKGSDKGASYYQLP